MTSPEDRIDELLRETISRLGETALPAETLAAAAEHVRRRATLKVLIWGPGPSGGEIYKKRCDVREQLKELGHEAHFSEDVWTPEVLRQSGLNLSVSEFLQARLYDYIVCLMASPGSVAEFHDFARDAKLASKMMICIDGSHREGYSAQGAIRIFEGHNGKVDWFVGSTDLAECHLATRVLEQIQKVAEAKQWEFATGGG